MRRQQQICGDEEAGSCSPLPFRIPLAIGFLSCTPGPASRAHAAEPGEGDEPPLLLGTARDFADGDLAAWRHKDNARIAATEDEGNPALRLSSEFG